MGGDEAAAAGRRDQRRSVTAVQGTALRARRWAGGYGRRRCRGHPPGLYAGAAEATARSRERARPPTFPPRGAPR